MRSPVVLGLDFGGTKIAAAVSEITGLRLGSTTVDILAEDDAPACLQRGITAARQLLEVTAAGRPLAAIGACTFGIPGDDGIALAPTIPGWNDLALGAELRRAFGHTEIRLATDVKAAAQAELAWGALAGYDPGIYLNLGTGLAVAIIANGRVVHGRHGAAGEIGYNLRSLHDVDRLLAERVPLEDSVSGKALTRAGLAVLPQVASAADVFAGAAHDRRMGRLLDDFITELSFHVVNLSIAIDPARIVVGGGMVRSWSQLHGGLRRALDAAVPFPPELVPADFPFDAPLMGALALAVTAAQDGVGQPAPA